MFKLLTVDVWDTLLRRYVHPDEVKYAAAHHLGLAVGHRLGGGIEVLVANEVLRRRRVIEAQLAAENRRAGGEGEYEIAEVIARLVAGFVGDERVARPIAEAAVDYEVNYEIRNAYLDPGIMGEIKAQGAERIWYVSDYYMTKVRLDGILAAKGIALDGGVVSCDVGKNKRRGGLYDYIKEKAGADCKAITHIGDDDYSDVKQARKHGIEAVHYAPESEERLRRERAARFMDREWSLRKIFAEASTECRAALASVDGPDDKALDNKARQRAYESGLASAPLFVGFALFIAEYAIKYAPEHLYFFTREGVFFKQVFDVLFPDGNHAGHPLPPNSLLHVSRRATFGPSLHKVDPHNLMRLWQLHSQQSLADLFESLNMPEVTGEIRARGFDCDKVRHRPWQDEEVIRLLADPAIQAMIEVKRQPLKEQLLGYLKQSGFFEPSKIAVVDIGWRGTIQDNLAYLNPEAELHGLYLGLAKFRNEQPGNTRKAAYVIDRNAAHKPSHEKRRGGKAALNQVDILEMLCSPAVGSVTNYRNNSGLWQPVTQETQAEERKSVEHFQQAVLDAAAAARDDIQRYAVSGEDLMKMSRRIFKGLMAPRGGALLEAYLRTEPDETFGIGITRPRHHLPKWRVILLAPFNATARLELITFLRLNQNRAVVWNRRGEGIGKRAFLVLLVSLALAYKKWLAPR